MFQIVLLVGDCISDIVPIDILDVVVTLFVGALLLLEFSVSALVHKHAFTLFSRRQENHRGQFLVYLLTNVIS